MRLYNGCPDDELAAVWESRANAKAEARKLGCVITYYPVEGEYVAAYLDDWSEASPFCPGPECCLWYVKEAAGRF